MTLYDTMMLWYPKITCDIHVAMMLYSYLMSPYGWNTDPMRRSTRTGYLNDTYKILQVPSTSDEYIQLYITLGSIIIKGCFMKSDKLASNILTPQDIHYISLLFIEYTYSLLFSVKVISLHVISQDIHYISLYMLEITRVIYEISHYMIIIDPNCLFITISQDIHCISLYMYII